MTSGVAQRSGYAASDAVAYDRFLGRWTAWLAPAFLDFARVPADGLVLDVGCGTGSLALALAARGRTSLGIDIAAPYVDFARCRSDGAALFAVGDAAALPHADGVFAGALAQLVLNFVPDAATAAAEMCRVTRRSGVVAACVWDFRGGLVYQRLFWDTAAGIDAGAGAARDRLFGSPLAQAGALGSLWRQAGLAEVAEGLLTIRMDFAEFADYWDPLLGGQGPFGSYVRGLEPELRERVRAAVRSAYLSGGPDGPRPMTAVAWVVRGVVDERRREKLPGGPSADRGWNPV